MLSNVSNIMFYQLSLIGQKKLIVLFVDIGTNDIQYNFN